MTADSPDNNTIVLGGAAQTGANSSKPGGVHNALPMGTRMGEFEIIGLVGEGGFGIVYLAQDHSLERKVALKEYMPASLAQRGSDSSVIVRSERHQETFEIGRRSFVNEARLLAQFDHAALVKVYRFWEAHGTAYMAMPYYDGRTLREVLQVQQRSPDEVWLKKMLDPVTDALSLIHDAQCYHRDIAPDNIMLLRDGRPVLLDFGAARRVISDMTQALTVILKPGYAPIEQYAEMPGMKQGPWTDIYALAAVIYYCVAQKLPPPSVSRIVQDSYEPLSEIAAGRYSNTFLRGIDHCLAVKAENRPQSMAEMRELIGIHLRPGSAGATVALKPSAAAAPIPVPAPQASPELILEPALALSPVPPASQPSHAAEPRPEPMSRQAPARQRPLSVDADEQRTSPEARSNKMPFIVGLGVFAATVVGAGWFYTQQKNPALPQAAISMPAATVILPPGNTPIPQAFSQPTAQPNIPVYAPTAPVSPVIEASAPHKSEPVYEPEPNKAEVPQPERVAPTAPVSKKTVTKPVEIKAAKPAKPASDAGDKAERDYMKQLNKDLDSMLK